MIRPYVHRRMAYNFWEKAKGNYVNTMLQRHIKALREAESFFSNDYYIDSYYKEVRQALQDNGLLIPAGKAQVSEGIFIAITKDLHKEGEK